MADVCHKHKPRKTTVNWGFLNVKTEISIRVGVDVLGTNKGYTRIIMKRKKH